MLRPKTQYRRRFVSQKDPSKWKMNQRVGVENDKRFRRDPPELIRALGFHWLLRYFNGEHIGEIAKSAHTGPKRVRAYMKSAAATLVDSAQETLLSEVFPKMVELLKASIDQQLKAATEGRPIDTSMIERLMKGLFITEAPQLKTQLTRDLEGGADTEVQTLEGFIAKKVLIPPRPTPVIDAVKVEDADAD